jgi:hypothetical protein
MEQRKKHKKKVAKWFDIRKAIIVNNLFEKGCCSLFITTLRQHEIKRITVISNL